MEVQLLYKKYSYVLAPSSKECVSMNEISNDQVPKSMVFAYFGPKSNKSKWKYNFYQTVEEAAAIYDLWQRVYNKCLMSTKRYLYSFPRV